MLTKKAGLVALFALFACCAYSLSANLVSLDVEYDYVSDDQYILCNYNFIWETSSGSMTGFFYCFEPNAIIDRQNSFAIVNRKANVALSIEKSDARYDICLAAGQRFSGRCEYTVRCKIEKTGTLSFAIKSSKFDTPVGNVILTILFAPEGSALEICDVRSTVPGSDIIIYKGESALRAIRVEKSSVMPNEEVSLSFRVGEAEQSGFSIDQSLDELSMQRLFQPLEVSESEYQNIAAIIRYFDVLFENLPESVINEFALSSKYDVYKSVYYDFGAMGQEYSAIEKLPNGNRLLLSSQVSDLYEVFSLFKYFLLELPNDSRERAESSMEYRYFLQLLERIEGVTL